MLCVAAGMSHLLAQGLRASLRGTRRSEERYRLISEVSADYTFSSVVDAEGRVRQDWVAGAFEAMTGYTFEDYSVRGGWRAALHPDDHAQDDRDLETLKANRPVVTEVRTLTRSGEVRWVRVCAHPVWDTAAGRLTGIYGAVQDISERKRAESEREALIGELAAKNAELERFTYTASHDLKSPLVTVRGYLGLVERDALAGNHEQLKADIQRIQQATDRMTRLLDELLDLSRVGRVVGPSKPIPFGELAEEAASLVAGRIAQRGAQVRIAEDLPVVLGDRVRLVQVVQNLLENAVKFLGDQKQPLVEVGARRQGEEAVLYVRDNGIGIDAPDQERVFRLFDKLDPVVEGAGVGLALVKRIVELHGGRVWVESEGRGRGSTFCFTLPAPA
jgi:PAS domain S-box-containing protein